jgi:transglutaminase-like putative cysteine protease
MVLRFKLKYTLVSIIFCAVNLFAQGTKGECDSICFSYYHIIAERLNLDVVDSYPQKIREYNSIEAPYDIIIKTFPAYQDSARRKLIESKPLVNNKISNAYPENVRIYLEPTLLIESGSSIIKSIADSLVDSNNTLLANIQRILKWVSNHVGYDKDLANKISRGESNTQSAVETLRRRKGTCSEYTNLFVAIMRSLGIPAKFITGVIIEKGHIMHHAWAECYIEGVGWHGVDPQTAQLWVPVIGIKLFEGKDFIDCNIKALPEIKATVKKIERP